MFILHLVKGKKRYMVTSQVPGMPSWYEEEIHFDTREEAEEYLASPLTYTPIGYHYEIVEV